MFWFMLAAVDGGPVEELRRLPYRRRLPLQSPPVLRFAIGALQRLAR